MTEGVEYSANEIETLVLKAARGGGLPLGLAEDLALAAGYLDFDKLALCPCHSGGDAYAIPRALDLLMAGQGPQTVQADAASIAAYVVLAQHQTGQTLVWTATSSGAVFERFEPRDPVAIAPLGRRILPDSLNAHLIEMASKNLVPETESSRLAGAGAGLTDND